MKIWIVIITAGLLTFLMRYLPMNSPFFHKLHFLKHEAFALLPLALLASLIGPNFLQASGNMSTGLIVGGLCTILVCKKTKSTLLGSLCGYAIFVAIANM